MNENMGAMDIDKICQAAGSLDESVKCKFSGLILFYNILNDKICASPKNGIENFGKLNISGH